jgi:hypothetical protein
MTYWQVKHGGNANPQTFRTLKAAREYAQVLNASLGYDFTIINKVNAPTKPLKIERELARLFSR